MARVEVSAARADLEDLISIHSLPADTRERVKRSLRHLERFPLLGPRSPADGKASASCSARGVG